MFDTHRLKIHEIYYDKKNLLHNCNRLLGVSGCQRNRKIWEKYRQNLRKTIFGFYAIFHKFYYPFSELRVIYHFFQEHFLGHVHSQPFILHLSHTTPHQLEANKNNRHANVIQSPNIAHFTK